MLDEATLDNSNNINLELLDFHKNENEPPPQFTFSTHIENLRITLNTLMKKKLKTPF